MDKNSNDIFIKMKDEIEKACNILNDSSLAKDSMVYQVWNDGEITLQKEGDLLWHKQIHQIAPPFETKGLNIEFKHIHNDRSYIFATEGIANQVREMIKSFLIKVKVSVQFINEECKKLFYILSGNDKGYYFMLYTDGSVYTRNEQNDELEEVYPPLIRKDYLKGKEEIKKLKINYSKLTFHNANVYNAITYSVLPFSQIKRIRKLMQECDELFY